MKAMNEREVPLEKQNIQNNNFQQQPNSNFNTTGKIDWRGNMARGAAIAGRKGISICQETDLSDLGLKVEIMQYDELPGILSAGGAQKLWFMQQENVKCRQPVIYIYNSGVKIEAGAMSYFQGPLQMTTGIQTLGKAISQMFTSKLTAERFAMPEYRGTGVLVLEPSFKHYFLMRLEQGESLIGDKGIFYAASLGVQIQPVFAGTATGSLIGGEGIFQQQITGPGFALLEIPVPFTELAEIELNNDILRVDGNFVVMREGSIQMSVERSSKTLVGSAVSGEGLVNVYRGTGKLWMAPSLKIYEAMDLAGYGSLARVNMNTSTGHNTVNN